MTSPTVTKYIPPVHSVGLPTGEVLDALLDGVVAVKRYAEIYEPDATTPFEITDWDRRLSSGSISVDSTRDERRMCDLMFTNKDSALDLNPIDGFWYDKIIKVFWGIEYWNTESVLSRWEMQVGEFMIDRIEEDYFPNMTKITGRDYTKKCLLSKILNSVQFDPGTPVETIIQALAANAGIKKFRLPYTGLSFTDPVVFPPNTARWEVMKLIANSVGYEIYFTPDGYLTMREYPDPATSPVTWIFRPGKGDGTLVKYRRSSDDSMVKNHSVVFGAAVEDELGFSQVAFGEARNDDPSSPTNIGRIGDRVDPFESQYITDQAQAQELAEQRLRISALEAYNIDFESLVVPFVEGGDIVNIENPKESKYTPVRFLLASYTLPLDLGPMSGLGRRVTIVPGPLRKYGTI